jgi:LmbE family N-acetylglucosaminyl deacetylase
MWFYISPHFDDIALSCGGLVWEQAHSGDEVVICTVTAGSPDRNAPLSPFAASLHQRWGVGVEAVAARREEDRASCSILGARPIYLSLTDCIYRNDPIQGTPLYDSNKTIMGKVNPAERKLTRALAEEMRSLFPPEAQVIAPLAIGGHVDHRLTRRAADLLRINLWYYADYPYTARWITRPGNSEEFPHMPSGNISKRAQNLYTQMLADGWQAQVFPISPTALDVWQHSVAAHASQISTFWPDLEWMRQALDDYCRNLGGIRLWRPPARQRLD